MGAAASERVVTLPDGRRLTVREGGSPGGVPVVFHHGTPGSRLQADLVEAAARREGVRLLSFDRPGYGSTPDLPPGLASVGADTVHVAGALGIEQFGTAGVSGGGPYALATAVAGQTTVSAVAVVAGIGPWTFIEPENPSDPERTLLALADAGSVDAALAGFRAQAAADFDDMLTLDDDALVDAYLDGAPSDDLTWLDREKRLLWAADVREALVTFDGYARDNVAWGGEWDIDISRVRCPVALYYGDQDRLVPATHGRWLADRIRSATLALLPGAGHGTTSFDHWDDILAALRTRLT